MVILLIFLGQIASNSSETAQYIFKLCFTLLILVFTNLKLKRCRNARAVESRMVILLTGGGLEIAPKPLYYISFKTQFYLRVFPFEGAEFQRLREVESLCSSW